jgi:putative CocE/NonD family hydrolase
MSKSILVERDVPVPMHDGTILRADIYRPDTSSRFPVLLQRTPYGKGFSETSYALIAAERDYAVVIQDTRGRWASEGDGYPFIYEKADGYDTIAWVANQSWSNGKVGMFGGSYVGYTQYAAAVSQHPALKTIIPAITFCDPQAVLYQGGTLALGAGLSWNLLAGAQMAIMRRNATPAEMAQLWSQFIAVVNGLGTGETFRHLPLTEIPLVGRTGLVTYLADAIAHPAHDDYWNQITCPYDKLTLPIFHLGGWYDIFISNTHRDFIALNSQGNLHQKLLIGPWTHGKFDNVNGEIDFGLQSSGILMLPEELMLHWFDFWLKDIDNGVKEEPPIRIFVMGDNQWRNENEWPLARTKYTSYYLHSQGRANSLNGDGSLSLEPPADEPVDTFVYDPRNPVPTRGGGLCCYQAALPPGAYDQREVEGRPDVLVYTSPPLDQNIEITGPIQLIVWITSNAPDTDFTAKLVDVGPCGYARNVQDGILRLRYREPGQVTPLHPGEAYPITIDLAATSNVFKANHRIRLEISSSNFPRFDRNTNTGRTLGEEIELRPALQTVLHDTQHPSHLILPLIPR